MKKWTLMLAAIALALYFGGCRKAETPIPEGEKHMQKVEKAKAEAKADGEKAKAVEPFVWPPLRAKGEAIEAAPNVLAKNYLVVLDGSGTMGESQCAGDYTKIGVAQKALDQFAKVLPEEANLGLVYFQYGEIHAALPLGTNNRPKFIEEVNKVGANGPTPLNRAIAEAYKLISKQGQAQNGYGEYTIVVVTDGQETVDSVASLDRTVKFIVENTPVAIYTIGFCINEKHSLNKSGITYRDANNPAELESALQGVLAEAPEFTAIEFEK